MALHKFSQRRPRLAQVRVSASSVCAATALLVLGGFVSANLAGCGGGGGGNSTRTVSPTLVVYRQDGGTSANSTVVISGGGLEVNQQYTTTENGRVVIPAIAPGTYQVAFTTTGLDGDCVRDQSNNCAETAREITISSDSSATYVLLQNDFVGEQNFVQGQILLNSPTDGQDANCTATETPILDEVIVRARKLGANSSTVVNEIVRSPQTELSGSAAGTYLISVPANIGTFRIEVDAPASSATDYAGTSATTTYIANSNLSGRLLLDNVDVCTNTTGQAPNPAPVPFPTPTPTNTPKPTSTPQAG